MTRQAYGKSFGGNPAENYQRFFVPFIGAPVADDLIETASLQPGQRVLDVACGTGVVTRLAAQRVGKTGAVTGLDVTPGMLAVARAQIPAGAMIDWREANAESMPFDEGAFDVVLCQMGLQFVTNKLAALREMRRVLATGGRVFINSPGPLPPLFAIMADALARYLNPKAAAFCEIVFALHDTDEIAGLLRGAGFREIDVQAKPKTLHLPRPADFLWQYLYSTPLAAAVAQADEAACIALEREVCAQWQKFTRHDGMQIEVDMTTGIAFK